MSAEDLDNLTGAAAAADAKAAPEPDPSAQQAKEGEVINAATELEEATADARLILAGASGFLVERWGIGLGPQTQERGAEKLAPLLVKYDLDSPFLRKWRLEVDAGVFVASTAYALYRAIKANKEAQAKEQQGGGQQGGDK